MHALTIVARNYLPQARVLAATFLEHHPEATFSTLVVDGTDDDRADLGAGDVMLITDIGLPTAEWRRMAAIYDVIELATALKAAALRHVLCTRAGSGQAVAYIDPDVQVMARFDDVFEHAVASGISLTPHLVEPMPRDGHTPDESAFRHAGIFNLGFACVGHLGRPFLDWWHERLRTDAIVDLAQGLFTDQRWVDWVPSLFPVTVERDPGLNVAYWNIHERVLSRADDGSMCVNGRPMRFFHFSGYDPAMPWQLSKHAGTLPRRVLSDDPLLRALCDDYGARLRVNGFGEHSTEYGFARAANGEVLHRGARIALRNAWLAADRGEGDPPPDVFEPAASAAFTRWCQPRVVRPAADRDPTGWNIVGHHRSEYADGEAARRITMALRALGAPTTLVDVDGADALERRDSIYCVDADGIGRCTSVLEHHGRARGDARRIGLWGWDHSAFPAHMAGAAELLDEVWVASEFARSAIEPVVGVPVRVVPLAVAAPTRATALRREHLGIPDRFVVTCTHELGVDAERQHSVGTVEAYRAAFGPDDGAVLVVAPTGIRRAPLELERLRWAAAGRPDILVVGEPWSAVEVQAATELSDCVVSLHRSVGFGFGLAAAMAVGTPVVATGWSGNLEFMDHDSAVLIPYELHEVGPGHGSCPAGAVWARPDLHAAADAMRRLFDHPHEARTLGAAGRDRVVRSHSIARSAAALEPEVWPALAGAR